MVNGMMDSSALKDYKRITDLNKIKISSPQEAIEILEELKTLDGEVISKSVLEMSIQNYLGAVNTDDISGLIKSFEEIEKLSTDEFDTSAVPVAKIKELEEDYQKYIEKGLNDKEALDQIYKENNGKIPSKEIENIVQKQRAKYQEKIKKVEDEPKEEIKKSFVEKKEVIDLNDYKKTETEDKEEIIIKEEEEEKTVDLSEYKNIVEQKIKNISKETRETMGGDDNFEKEIQIKIESIINEDEVKTSNEEINDLAETMEEGLIIKDDNEIKIEAKKIRIEIEKWTEENIQEVEKFKKEEFEKKFIEETKKLNPDLKSEELNEVKELSKLVSGVYLGESIIENQKDEALQNNSQMFSPGKLENAWTDLKGITNFLTKKPEEIKSITNKYESIKNNLKNVKLPGNIKEFRSFDNVISIFNNQGTSQLFSRTQRYLGWIDKADKITGGWINKTIIKAGEKWITKIGNQAIQEFATNALGTMAKEGFQKGFSTVLKGILNGGVKAATKTAASGAVTAGVAGAEAAAGAAVSATGVGAIVVAALAAIKAIKKIGTKIADSLGINIKKGLQETFGKVGGALINGAIFIVGLPALLMGMLSATLIMPILLLVFGGLFGYQMLMGNAVSSLVPPEGSGAPPEEVVSPAPTIDPNRVIPEGCPNGWPTSKGRITQGPNGGYSHQGRQAIDIGGGVNGEPIYATHDGIATTAGGPGDSGYGVEIVGMCQGVEFRTKYWHLPGWTFSGQKTVKRGDVIGYVDNSGNSTGPHLHYEIYNLGSINDYLPLAIPDGYQGDKSDLIFQWR